MPPLDTITREPKASDLDAGAAGLVQRMHAVIEQLHVARAELSPDAVHDLRVALRRCRSIAEGAGAIDSHRSWRRLRRASRSLFRQLGALRDAHVMAEWIEKLAPAGDTARERLSAQIHAREAQLARSARDAVFEFDDAAWRALAAVVAARAERLRPGSAVFRHLALERWTEARALHDAALESGSGEAFHALRIGVKRFRYTVENFLPRKYEVWAKQFKRVQDSLGEMHDLDLLWGAIAAAEPPLSDEELAEWRDVLSNELESRLSDYHERMSGDDSLWAEWRDGLPDEGALPAVSFARVAAWAALRDPAPRHARRVARLAVEIFDGLGALERAHPFGDRRSRRSLRGAALAHHIGRAGGRSRRHKRTYRLLTELRAPLGWEEDEIRAVAIIARYYRGSEPHASHAGFRDLDAAGRTAVSALAGVLRIADALDSRHDGAVAHVRVESAPPAILVRAFGYEEDQRTAARMGGRKRLLESVLGRPIVVLGAQRDESPAIRAGARPPR
ncbi:MAG: CHAD domain-containing protein [bacterium]